MFFLLKFASFTRYYVCKKASICGLISTHVTTKMVISLKIQQNIDLLQHVTLKSVDFRVKPLKFDFTLTCDHKDVNSTLNYRSKLGLALKVRVTKQG